MNLKDSVRNISGVGEKTEKALDKVNVSTVRDLLYYLPRTYRDLSKVRKLADISLGEMALFCVQVDTDLHTRRVRRGMEITSFEVSDDSLTVNVDIFNQIHVKSYIKKGDTVYLYGKLVYNKNKVSIASPEIYFQKPADPFAPIYPLTAGLKQNMLRKMIKYAISNTSMKEIYSVRFRQQFALPDIKSALLGVHFPRDLEQVKQARARVVFDELLIFCRMIELLNEEKLENNQIVLRILEPDISGFTAKLGFTPTHAQNKVMRDIAADFGKPCYMNRLIQGDVGSGKTVLAFFAMDCLARNGYQSIMMAPTEILAEQHCKTAAALFPEEQIVRVSGAMTAKQRREAKQRIADGSAKIIIGTHALIYGDVEFHNLGLLITDEQHRFGVKQRAAIAGKHDVHSLIMSATPIPRSLALVLYGKTEVSIVDELPPGRKDVKTYMIREPKYRDMIDFIHRELKKGRQAYIVCPLIEESENDDLKSAQEMFAEIGKHYKGIPMALLHGKLKNAQKQEIMKLFAAGETRILVSTTVIEVGINVPNATVMAVQNAERFGLAQLHQLRGRVGRGTEQSYCFLISDNQNAMERLKVMTLTNDGFEIAEKDMQFRGAGDVFGTRQHGQGALVVANLVQDMKQLEKAREVLKRLAQGSEFGAEYENITKAAMELTKQKMMEIALN